MFSFFNQAHNYGTRLENYRKQTNTIPDNIFLIWFGPVIPNSAERPYQDNIIKHKKLNPDAKVYIYVAKSQLSEGEWERLDEKFKAEGVILSDFEEESSGYINFALINTLLHNPDDYVIASNQLRLALIYYRGGWYFDTDLKPTKPLEKKNPPYGFYQNFPLGQKGPDFCFQAAVQHHFIYLLAMLINRYLLEGVIFLEKEKEPKWLRSPAAGVRQRVVSSLAGNAIYYLAQKTSMFNIFHHTVSYPLEDYMQIAYDQSWLDQYSTQQHFTAEEQTALRGQYREFQKYLQSKLDNLFELDLVKFEREQAFTIRHYDSPPEYDASQFVSKKR